MVLLNAYLTADAFRHILARSSANGKRRFMRKLSCAPSLTHAPRERAR
jgi:hypothetical protein